MRILLIILFFNSLSLFSQDCKFSQNETDEFTGEIILRTSMEVLSYGAGQREAVRIQGLKVNNQKFLDLWLVLTDVFRIEKEGRFMLMTEEGLPYELNFNETKIADYHHYPHTTTWAINTRIPLSEIEYMTLKALNFTKLRYYTDKGYVEHKINKKRQNIVKKVITCI